MLVGVSLPYWPTSRPGPRDGTCCLLANSTAMNMQSELLEAAQCSLNTTCRAHSAGPSSGRFHQSFRFSLWSAPCMSSKRTREDPHRRPNPSGFASAIDLDIQPSRAAPLRARRLLCLFHLRWMEGDQGLFSTTASTVPRRLTPPRAGSQSRSGNPIHLVQVGS